MLAKITGFAKVYSLNPDPDLFIFSLTMLLSHSIEYLLGPQLHGDIIVEESPAQETSTWLPIWSSALPQLSTVNIQLSGDCYSKISLPCGAFCGKVCH